MIEKSKYKLLFDIDSPADIRGFDSSNLKLLCDEIREYMIDVVSQTGGHFASGLGSVELTVALHKVFNTPVDKIVWDTGHQAYPHKIITGRRDKMTTIRQLNGLSGFLKRTESEFDAFGAGHASTSISAAVGIAEANKKLGHDEKKVIAVIGDGAMTGGMAYEALNNAGINKSNVIVALNDNNMSISPNVWQISNYFTEMIAHPEYNRFKGAIWDFTGKLDNFGDRLRRVAARLESGIKAIITPGMLFEALGFRYFGPVNGHNITQLVKLFEHVKAFNGPILVHILSEKGKGYKPAEGNKQKYHGVTPFDKMTGKSLKAGSTKPSYTSVFGNAMVELVKEKTNIVGITAAMADGTGLNKLAEEHPENFFDVGIAEEHAATFAAGLATQGVTPVVAVYSSFLQRAYDQIIHDIALQKLPVVFAVDRAGLVGADGPTHHGTFDISFLRTVPNMVIMAPSNEVELRNMLYTAVNYDKGPVALRYPRGNALGIDMKDGFEKIEIGKFVRLKEGKDVAVLALGRMVEYAIEAVEKLNDMGISAELIDARFAKPLDEEMLNDLQERFAKIITIEENSLVGGFGTGVVEYFNNQNYKNEILNIGLPDRFIDHGTQAELHKLLEIDAEGIVKRTLCFLEKINEDCLE